MVKRKGLGRGISALFPEKEDKVVEKTETLGVVNEEKVEKNNEKSLKSKSDNIDNEIIENIKLTDIKASEDNPRKNFDIEALENLAQSIRLYGIIQPLVLMKNRGKYEIIAGERRYRAAVLAGLEEVPAIVKKLTSKDKDMISMVENIQREDLNPYEEALAYKNIMLKYSLTQNELSDIIGKSRTYIANIVRLLGLDKDTIKELEEGNITSSQGRALLSVEDLKLRSKYLKMLIRNEITVNEIEKRSSSKLPKVKDIYIRDLEERFKESIGAKVKINKAKNSWKVNIEFFDDEQIEDFLKRYQLGD
ncbi:ParB/RepB/Spo0J family partition protein [Peptoniphilaceae bacterium SGI.131]